MLIRKAGVEDIPAIMKLVNQAKEYMKEKGINQWQNGYPSEKIFEQDIQLKHSYVLCEGEKIIATAAILFALDQNYKLIDGKWLNEESYGVIHRIAVDNAYKGKGIAGQLFDYGEQLALNKGIVNMRIDTHKDNYSMQRLILKQGYHYCGIVTMQDLSKRLAFHKVLNKSDNGK